MLLDRVDGKFSVEGNSVDEGFSMDGVVLARAVVESASVVCCLGVVMAAYVVPFDGFHPVASTTGSAVVAAGVEGGGGSGRMVHGKYPKQLSKNILVLHSIAPWQISMHAWLTVEQTSLMLEGAGSGAVAKWLTRSNTATPAHSLHSPISVESAAQVAKMSSLHTHPTMLATAGPKSRAPTTESINDACDGGVQRNERRTSKLMATNTTEKRKTGRQW